MNRPTHGRRRRRATRLAAAVAAVGATALVASHAAPASAYTVQQINHDTVVLTSTRMESDTVKARLTVNIFRDGTYSWYVDVHNTGVKRKFFDIWCNVHFNTIFDEFRAGPAERLTVRGRRHNDGRDTFYHVGTWARPSIKDHFDDLLPAFPADCHLRHRGPFE
jgi:hypothetical protein